MFLLSGLRIVLHMQTLRVEGPHIFTDSVSEAIKCPHMDRLKVLFADNPTMSFPPNHILHDMVISGGFWSKYWGSR